MNIRNIGPNYWLMVKKSIAFIILLCKMPDIFKLLDNLCHKILVFQFIQSSYSLEIVSLRISLVMPTIRLLYILILFSE